MSSAKVANIALKALLAQTPVIIIGRLNAFMALSTRLMPRTLAAALVYPLIKN
jgi:short-subunit dehydrogenase